MDYANTQEILMTTTTPRFGTSFSVSGWSLLSNLSAFDNAYAQSGTAPGNTAFPALDVCDPDFSDIDDAEQIASVTVAMEAKYLSKVSYLNSIQLLVGGTLYGSPQGPSANLQASPDSSLSYTFSTPGLTGADIKTSGFGVRTIFKRKVGKGIGAVAVDSVTLAATY